MIYEYKDRKYRTASALCEAVGVNRTTFVKRLKRGMTLDEALTVIPDTYDHAGNKFYNVERMCEFYKINKTTFYNRIRAGWSLEDALTVPTYRALRKIDNKRNFVRMKVPFTKIRCKDHIGNYFKSRTEMCKYWGIGLSTYYARKNEGWSLEKILTTDIKRYNICRK